MSFETKGFPHYFDHPFAGNSEREARYLAVRWRAGVDQETKERVVATANLTPVDSGDGARPRARVNRTDGLWWVQRQDGAPVGEDVFDQLAGNEAVEWMGPGYRAAGTTTPPTVPTVAGAPTGAGGVYAVNPNRMYVRRSDMRSIGRGLAVDETHSSRIPDYVAMRVTEGTALTAIGSVRTSLSAAGTQTSGAVRLETIPFLSPTTHQKVAPTPKVAAQPNDPMFPQQWNLGRIKAVDAWKITHGKPSTVIAVIDEGVDLQHEDLLVGGVSWNASYDVPDGSAVGSHGTACAGIAAARMNNKKGVAGVAGGATVMAIATATWADVDVAEGLYFAADNGARVVSMSFGVYPEWGVWDFDLIRNALQYAYDRNVLLVAASGNEDGPVSRFPGSDARTICVGGINRSDERKRTGDASAEPWWGASYGTDVDVVAPCLQICTTDRSGYDGYTMDNYFDSFNGTSSATPQVAGLGALLFSLVPELDNAHARKLIESTCAKISPQLYAYRSVAHKPSSTWNEEVGYGRIDAEAALRAAQQWAAKAGLRTR